MQIRSIINILIYARTLLNFAFGMGSVWVQYGYVARTVRQLSAYAVIEISGGGATHLGQYVYMANFVNIYAVIKLTHEHPVSSFLNSSNLFWVKQSLGAHIKKIKKKQKTVASRAGDIGRCFQS